MKVLVAPPKGKLEKETYINWLNINGFTSIILDDSITNIDAPLLLCGGADIGVNTKRDNLEIKWIESALKNNQPIIGICKGMQILNFYFGGKVSNLPKNISEIHTIDIFKDDEDHSQRISGFHNVIDINGNLTEVNSRHHQYCETIASNFNATHYSLDSDKIVEGIEDDEKRIWAVQWHPEYNKSTDNKYPLNKL
jgi:gamma-glutamyl-gamma-aminobutyrate hydrolase PuuD